MPLLHAIPLIVLAVLAGVSAAYYATMWWRITRVERSVPTLRDGLSRRAGGVESGAEASSDTERVPVRVCIIVPAHNERDVIERLAVSICRLEVGGRGALEVSGRALDTGWKPVAPEPVAQELAGPIEVRAVFVLDRCTDDTAALLRAALEAHAPGAEGRARFEIIENTQCPEGWTGKNHAAHRGVRDSGLARDAEYLCFIDADTAFEPAGLAAALGLMRSHGLDMLSLLSTLDIRAWFEGVVQPAAGIELVRQFPLDLVNRPDSNRAFANGQFMLFRRGAYEAVGGHEKVKHELLEDLAFARKIKWNHKELRLGVVLADGLFRCRMYRSWPAFERGWKRIYTEAARRRPARLRMNAWRLRVIGGGLPVLAAGAFVAGPIVMKLGDMPLGASLLVTGGAGVYAYAGAVGRALRAQHAAAWLMLLYPLGAWFAAGLMGKAASDLKRGEATQWAGKSYARQVRP